MYNNERFEIRAEIQMTVLLSVGFFHAEFDHVLKQNKNSGY